MNAQYQLLEKILKENNMNAEDALYSALFVVDIESRTDMEFLKEYYNLEGEGYYLKVDVEGDSLEISKNGHFFSEHSIPSSIFIEYITKNNI